MSDEKQGGLFDRPLSTDGVDGPAGLEFRRPIVRSHPSIPVEVGDRVIVRRSASVFERGTVVNLDPDCPDGFVVQVDTGDGELSWVRVSSLVQVDPVAASQPDEPNRAPRHDTATTWSEDAGYESVRDQDEPPRPDGDGWVPFAGGVADGVLFTRWRREVKA